MSAKRAFCNGRGVVRRGGHVGRATRTVLFVILLLVCLVAMFEAPTNPVPPAKSRVALLAPSRAGLKLPSVRIAIHSSGSAQDAEHIITALEHAGLEQVGVGELLVFDCALNLSKEGATASCFMEGKFGGSCVRNVEKVPHQKVVKVLEDFYRKDCELGGIIPAEHSRVVKRDRGG